MSEWKEQSVQLAKEGLSWRKIAKRLDVPKSTMSDWLRKMLSNASAIDVETPTNNSYKGANILLLDIESSPLMAAVWRMWKENVGLEQIQADWFIMSFSAKWLGSEEVFYNDCRGSLDDKQLLNDILVLLNDADIVVCHNVKFDIPKIKARLIQQGYPPPKPFKTYCTLEASKRIFGFTSNKLAYLTQQFGTHEKSDHAKFPGFKLWSECLKGNVEAWEEMKLYNIKDTLGLEDVYLTLRAWDDKHPNVNVYNADETKRCTACGSDKLTEEGFAFTNTGMYNQHRCEGCGKYNRSRYTINSVAKRKSLLT